MDSDQIWFFLWENMKPTASVPPFKQGHLLLAEVKTCGMSLKKCLEIASVDSTVDKHTFWIHSNSMKAAVQLLSDKSIEVTWSLYCQSDDVVTVHIRTAKDPSPNTSKASSHNNSLAERRKVSGQRRRVSEIFIRTPLDHVTSGLDAATLEPIRDLDDNDKVTINIGGGKTETLSKDYLLGWITAQVTAGKAVSNITVTTMTQNRRPKEIVLTDDIWHTSLLRGPWKADFQPIWEQSTYSVYERNKALENLKTIPGFKDNAKLFIRDLRYFGRDVKAQNRLNETKHEYFLGGKYFSPSTVAAILALPIGMSTVKDELENIARRKVEREQQNEICASHDLSPIFEAAFGLDWKDLKAEEAEVLQSKENQKSDKKNLGGTMGRGLKKARSTLFGKKKDGDNQ